MKKEIIQSLQEEAIWIVPDHLKNEYERLLIECSSNHAILFQKVMSISLYYEELLKKHQYFMWHKITKNEKLKKIMRLIDEGDYQYLHLDNFSDVVDMIDTMQKEAIDEFPDVANLPLFTVQKLEECFDLYSKYMLILKRENLFDHRYDLVLPDSRKIYVAGFGKLTKSEAHFLQDKNVTYVEVDQGSQDIYVSNFLNIQLEMEAICHDIVVKVNQGAKLSDFMVYVPSDHQELLMMNLKKYHIPFNGDENISDDIFHTLRLIQKYLFIHDPAILIELMYINNTKEMVWQYDKDLKMGNREYFSQARKINQLKECKTMKQISECLIEVMKSFHLNRFNEKFGEIYNYIMSYDLPMDIQLDDYFNIILHYFPNLVRNKDSLEAINFQNLGSISPVKRYTYILGCNEEKFPVITKDKGLLLNEGKVAFSMDTLIDEIESQKKVIEEIVKSANTLYLSYPTSTNGGEALLKSSFLAELENQYPIQKKKYEFNEIVSLEAESRYLVDMDHESIQDAITLSKNYQKSQNQPGPVFIQKDKDLSVSEIEAFNGCPFKYYMTYDLGIRKWKNRNMARNDFGTLRHDIVEKCSPYINGGDLDIDPIIEQMCVKAKLNATNSNEQAYYFEQIEKQMKLTVRVLRYQNMAGNFMIKEHEVDVKEENGIYSIHGRFDRKDTFNQYARIIDYKSSNKELNVDLARLGFNIQMLLYADMLEEMPAGVLYFNMAPRVIKNAKLHQVELKQFYKEYKMNGLLVNDESSLEAMNVEHLDDILPMKYTKKGISGSILEKEELEELLEDIHHRISEIMDQIFEEGNIEINPATSRNDKIQHVIHPCTYCDFRSVCLLDIFYQSGREIKVGGEEDETE